MSEVKTTGPNHKQTLCWDCANATGGCSWADHDDHTPVKGWEAIETRVNAHSPSSAIKDTQSFIVLTCPEFIRDAEGFGVRRIGGDSRMTHRLSDSEKQTIIQAYQCGVKIREICEATGYSETGIYRMLKRSGILMEREPGRKNKRTPAWQGKGKEEWT